MSTHYDKKIKNPSKNRTKHEEINTMEEIISLISNVGFPIAITIYLLLTRDKTIDANTMAINKLIDVVEDLKEKIK